MKRILCISVCLYWGFIMEEYLIKQKIENAYAEPQAGQELIGAVILRAKAVSMGVQAQKQLETASADQVAFLAARALIGQLAMVSPLPPDVPPEQLARQLQQEEAFHAALRGGNVLRRIQNGELMQQVVGPQPDVETIPEGPKIDGPTL